MLFKKYENPSYGNASRDVGWAGLKPLRIQVAPDFGGGQQLKQAAASLLLAWDLLRLLHTIYKFNFAIWKHAAK